MLSSLLFCYVRFRQYGLWDRYTDLYPKTDLVYTVGVSNYETDWFFAHVTRKVGNNTYIPTTWTILFDLENVEPTGNYTIQLALASATAAELHVRTLQKFIYLLVSTFTFP
jgi:rhamnogalacturonan endolyase